MGGTVRCGLTGAVHRVNDVVGVEVGDVEDADGNGHGMTCLEGDMLPLG